MMKLAGVCVAATWMALCLGTGAVSAMGVGLPAGFAGGYMQDRWDAPPPELGEVERKGFHDGIEGAHKDAGNHRAFNVNNRDEFRHPHVPDRDKEAYRHGFERGYQAGVAHWEREHRW